MLNIKKLIAPTVLIVATVLAANFILSNPPESKRRGLSKAPQMTVEAVTLEGQPYPVVIESYGTVKPRTQSVLVSQVSGQITSVSNKFREGGFFERGDVLVTLDDRDYIAEVNVAKAGLLSAQQVLLEEQARSEQAKIDWGRLNNDKQANELVLRKPQLEAAKASVLSAQAQLQKAELSLERTKITAPFAGRILSKSVDLGQVISSNTQLADIYATDYVEIRLPIKNKDLDLISLPEEFRGQSNAGQAPQVVTLRSDLIGNQTWAGRLVRTEGAIDSESQQLYVVAQIDEPFAAKRQNEAGVPIKIGQYVTADIPGDILENALVVPTKAIYQGSYVYLIVDGMLRRTDVSIKWQNGEEAIVSSGLSAGDVLVTSPLGQVSSGTRVSIYGEQTMIKEGKGVARKPASDQALQEMINEMPEQRRSRLAQKAEELGVSEVEALKRMRTERGSQMKKGPNSRAGGES